MSENDLARAVLGGWCFPCLKAVYRRVHLVTKVTSGYADGALENATTQQKCANQTGHTEVAAVTYTAEKVGYNRFLELFWQMHAPTTKDRQMVDTGPQNRSIILATDEEQERAAMASREDTQTSFPSHIVTKAMRLERFGTAAVEDRNYYKRYRGAMSSQFVTRPRQYNLGVGHA